jgi:hypothetical protein
MLYVDPAIHKWKGSLWCHLTADSLEELHNFAINSLGLKREWFQDKAIPHYDVIESKRKIAIEKGAIAISLKEMCDRRRKLLKNSAPQQP